MFIDKGYVLGNGYNNTIGNHNTNDGLEEFEEILKKNNLKFINGKLEEL
jgi:hypothetical protein